MLQGTRRVHAIGSGYGHESVKLHNNEMETSDMLSQIRHGTMENAIKHERQHLRGAVPRKYALNRR